MIEYTLNMSQPDNAENTAVAGRSYTSIKLIKLNNAANGHVRCVDNNHFALGGHGQQLCHVCRLTTTFCCSICRCPDNHQISHPVWLCMQNKQIFQFVNLKIAYNVSLTPEGFDELLQSMRGINCYFIYHNFINFTFSTQLEPTQEELVVTKETNEEYLNRS